jgi:predicted metal-dependent hydrolase
MSETEIRAPIPEIIRTKRKTITLQIQENGSLVIRAPFSADDEYIRNLVYQRRSWIEKKRRLVLQRNRQRADRRFVDGEVFLFLGRVHRLRIVNHDAQPLAFHKGEFLLSKSSLRSAKEVLMNWYQKKAGEIIRERVDHYASRTGAEYKKIRITRARKRWGSCSSLGNLNFSWSLVMAPLDIIDYVVVHEITHLTQKNHSKDFWKRVELLIPDHKKRRAWLRENEYSLSF